MRSAMHAASQLPGRGPTVVDIVGVITKLLGFFSIVLSFLDRQEPQ